MYSGSFLRSFSSEMQSTEAREYIISSAYAELPVMLIVQFQLSENAVLTRAHTSSRCDANVASMA